MADILRPMKFSDVNLQDPFFDSLKADYAEFEDWFHRKGNKEAYVLDDSGCIQAFLYLKLELEPVNDVDPPMQQARRRVKVGTLKVNPHGTRLGERCVKKALDFAVAEGAEELYVTVFPKHAALKQLLETYGFVKHGAKTTKNGTEDVLVKSLSTLSGDLLLDYPKVDARRASKYLLSVWPEYHTRLFPDSILNNEPFNVIDDVSHTNSIHKVYLCRMDVSELERGDILVIYRTSDKKGPAWYRSVATSVCVVEECLPRDSFGSSADLIDYCRSYSVFSDNELEELYRQRSLQVIRMTYNLAMKRRLTRQRLVEEVGLDTDEYWGFMELSDHEFRAITEVGEVDESLIIY